MGDKEAKPEISILIAVAQATRPFLIVLGVLIIGACNPFGIDNVDKDVTDKLFNRVFSHFYECAFPFDWFTESPFKLPFGCPSEEEWQAGSRTIAKNNILVVLITPETLELLDQDDHFLPYEAWDVLLDSIRNSKPKAVFVDVIFEDRILPHMHPDLDALRSTINGFNDDRSDSSIPLYFAKGRGSNPIAQNDDPSLLAVKHRERGITYPLYTDNGHSQAPATALYSTYCEHDLSLKKEVQEKKPSKKEYVENIGCAHKEPGGWIDAQNKNQILSMLWGRYTTATKNKYQVNNTCLAKKQTKPFRGALNSIWIELTQGMRASKDDPGREPCMYNTWIDARFLFEPEPDLDLTDLLKDKLVLVGIDQQLSGDTIISPVHGKTSGVFYHAMALDNLIANGKSTFKIPPVKTFGSFDLGDFFTALICMIGAHLIFRWSYQVNKLSNSGDKPKLPLKQCIWYPILLALFILFLYLVIAAYYNMVPYGGLYVISMGCLLWATSLLSPLLAAFYARYPTKPYARVSFVLAYLFSPTTTTRGSEQSRSPSPPEPSEPPADANKSDEQLDK